MVSLKIATVICKSVRTLAQDTTQGKMVGNYDLRGYGPQPEAVSGILSSEAAARPPLDGLVDVQRDLLRLLVHASIPLRSTVEASAP